MKLRIYENDTLTSEIDHSPRQEAILKTDIQMRKQNGENVRYEVYKPAPVYTLAELKARKIAELESEASRCILAVIPQYQQINAALGIYDTTRAGEIKATINAFRAVVHNTKAIIDKATKAELENLTWEWPDV